MDRITRDKLSNKEEQRDPGWVVHSSTWDARVGMSL